MRRGLARPDIGLVAHSMLASRSVITPDTVASITDTAEAMATMAILDMGTAATDTDTRMAGTDIEAFTRRTMPLTHAVVSEAGIQDMAVIVEQDHPQYEHA